MGPFLALGLNKDCPKPSTVPGAQEAPVNVCQHEQTPPKPHPGSTHSHVSQGHQPSFWQRPKPPYPAYIPTIPLPRFCLPPATQACLLDLTNKSASPALPWGLISEPESILFLASVDARSRTTLPLFNFTTVGRRMPLSDPQFVHLYNGDSTY